MLYIAPAPAAAETLKFRFWIRVSAAVRVSSVGVTASMQKNDSSCFACNFLCSDTAILLGTAVRDCNSVLDCGLSLRFFSR